MSKLGFLCTGCGKARADRADAPCFFCVSADKIAKLQRDLSGRERSFGKSKAAHEVKNYHRHLGIFTRGRNRG